ncbi:GntR family transcriptional regulator [Cohnella sp. JJ-181]|uniref:GntR family transcriptional regulator n=1 Tax=Cohnella rhizoplanae TaxID=2974897 RepID=UPI0022FF7EE1|nr:GntR family transcriptional regulator [Cohnella sp. JJ-181]CAI6015711.1 Arabinose metabolism transcriptional repressor [Cohnella sp. JJ-181]
MSGPMYEKIYEALKEEIQAGQYGVGDRVPSEKELADAYSVSRITSKKALELLAEAGIIVRKPGKGSFVADPAARPSTPSLASVARGGRGGNEAGLLIGLVMTDFGDSYGTGLIYGLEEATRQHHSYLILRRTFGIPAYEEEAIKGLLELGVDGLIIFPAQGEYFNPEILKLVIDKFPFVLVDRHLKGISAGSISTDNVAGAKRGVDYLFELGHRHIALLSPPPMDTTAVEDRIEGFVQAHAEKGVIVDRELWLDDITSTLPNAYNEENKAKDIEKVKRLLLAQPHITAFFAMEYNIALLAAEAARQLNLDVPSDLSIVCFDCPASSGDYPFTHLRQNQEEIGRLAFDNVLRLRAGENLPGKIALEAQLVPGASTAVSVGKVSS